MRARVLVAAVAMLLGWVVPAAGEPRSERIDIKPFRDSLLVLKDAEGGIYAVTADPKGEPRMFYGTSKVLHAQVSGGTRSRDGDSWNFSIFAPRLPYPFMSTIERRKDGSYWVTCGQAIAHGLTLLTGDKAKEILDKAKFMTTVLVRRPLLLARDDRGVYYYVDVLTAAHGGNGHRLLIGKKGAMKQMPLTDVITDTGGEVYNTKIGDLRLVHTADGGKAQVSSTWVRGEKRVELITLDTYMNQPLIYRELGVYKMPNVICAAY